MTSDDFYLHTDIPPGVTIAEYRRSRRRRPNAFRRVITAGVVMMTRPLFGREKRETPARNAGACGPAGIIP